MFCKYCGKQLDDDAVFCSACGERLTASEPEPVDEYTPEEQQSSVYEPVRDMTVYKEVREDEFIDLFEYWEKTSTARKAAMLFVCSIVAAWSAMLVLTVFFPSIFN